MINSNMINPNYDPFLVDAFNLMNHYDGAENHQTLPHYVHPPPPDHSSLNPQPVSVQLVNNININNNNNNQPTTPNSCSISSEATNDQEKNIKPVVDGGKKRKGKREREGRFAFMTKSQVDHLEDGYRWRKYGQKAVKNTSFPRSYYRCTSASCNVKKRVERSFTDPSIVVTTYEGQHSHPSTVLPHGPGFGPGFGSFALHHPIMQMGNNTDFIYNYSNINSENNNNGLWLSATNNNVGFLRDNGLLQDMILPNYSPTMKTENN